MKRKLSDKELKAKFWKKINFIGFNETDDIVSSYEELIDQYNKKYPHINWNKEFEEGGEPKEARYNGSSY